MLCVKTMRDMIAKLQDGYKKNKVEDTHEEKIFSLSINANLPLCDP